MESILDSIKLLLDIETDDSSFDTQLLIHINTALSFLNQLGVTTAEDFEVTGNKETWNDLLGGPTLLRPVKTYVYLKVKLVFDPPQSSSIQQCFEKNVAELEYRINLEAERM